MLVITGTGRSGTSVLARFCSECGYDVGGTWFDAVDAGMEDRSFAETNAKIIRGDIDEDTFDFVKKFNKPVVKDPRFLTAPAAKYWANARRDLQVLVCVRDMQHVATSVDLFTGHDKTHLDWAVRKTHEIMLAFVELAKHEIPIRMLAFPSCLENYSTVLRALQWGGLSIPYEAGKATWASLADVKKVHHK